MHFRSPGHGQRDTLIANGRGIVEVQHPLRYGLFFFLFKEKQWSVVSEAVLAGRPGNPQAAPMLRDRPSVMDMLRGV